MIADDRPQRSAIHRLVRHPSGPLVLLTGAAGVILIGTFVPWLRSGSTTRTSYELLGVLARLDLATDGVVSLLVRGWPLVPFLVTTAVVAAWWRWTWVATITAVVAALYAGGVASIMLMAAHRTGIDSAAGPWVCSVGSLMLLVAAAWMATCTINATRHGARAPASAAPGDRS